MKAVILTAQLFQDQELIYPLYRLDEAGWDLEVATSGGVDIQGIIGVKIAATIAIKALRVEDFDLLIIPGGVKAMEKLRLDSDAVKFVRNFYDAGKVIGSICSGAQMLISAGVCKGRRISAYPSMAIDVQNAGAMWSEVPCVDGNLVTAPHYRDVGKWMGLVLDTVAKRAA